MKELITAIALLLSISVFAQARDSYEQSEAYKSILYINLSTGLDNYTGILGVGLTVPVYNDFALRAGAGVGAWGPKYSFGIKYQDLSKKGVGFGIGYSHCPGVDGVQLDAEDENGENQTFDIDYFQVGSINFTINKNWLFRNGNIFYLESGYAFKTGGKNFYRNNSDDVLSEDYEVVFDILRPGGIILAFGFQFGIK